MREVWLGSTVVGAGGGGPGDGAGVAEETEDLRCRDGLGELLGHQRSQEAGGTSAGSRCRC